MPSKVTSNKTQNLSNLTTCHTSSTSQSSRNQSLLSWAAYYQSPTQFSVVNHTQASAATITRSLNQYIQYGVWPWPAPAHQGTLIRKMIVVWQGISKRLSRLWPQSPNFSYVSPHAIWSRRRTLEAIHYSWFKQATYTAYDLRNPKKAVDVGHQMYCNLRVCSAVRPIESHIWKVWRTSPQFAFWETNRDQKVIVCTKSSWICLGIFDQRYAYKWVRGQWMKL